MIGKSWMFRTYRNITKIKLPRRLSSNIWCEVVGYKWKKLRGKI
jgi:hypothetical protein